MQKKDILCSLSCVYHLNIRTFAPDFSISNIYVRIKENKDRIGVCLP